MLERPDRFGQPKGKCRWGTQRDESGSSHFVTSSGEKRYKPLKDQVEQLKKAIHMTCLGTPNRAEKECKNMEEEVKKLCEVQQKTLEVRVSLHLVFKDEGEKCERRMKQLEEEARGRSVNRKAKAEIKALKEKHGKYSKLMIMCQGVAPWMREDVEKAEPDPKQKERGAPYYAPDDGSRMSTSVLIVQSQRFGSVGQATPTYNDGRSGLAEEAENSDRGRGTGHRRLSRK